MDLRYGNGAMKNTLVIHGIFYHNLKKIAIALFNYNNLFTILYPQNAVACRFSVKFR